MDSTKRERCIQKARELAVEYQGTLVGCGHCSFAAALDALRMEGIELVPEEIEEELFKGVLGLTGGIGNLGVGTCGAVSGASFAISLACNIGPKELAPNKALRWIPYYYVKEGLLKPWMEKYGGITCRETQLKIFGIAINSRMPANNKALFEEAQRLKCRNASRCTIANAAALATQTILDIIENPKELKWIGIDEETTIANLLDMIEHPDDPKWKNA
ncbi:C-GCAxxG-C-C family protein [Atribacter laminatus]|jgi:hypothetical protein|uniref:C_GCAxxG_C_C family protein n=1 Tax=Atribacter laminatus TaxID=2847778 RepID=A0A7T1F274_ATRLM|nr:C-GCAxxG-C-C family protein [Atribacter laminatus]QPM67487.1 hypothetical protein RT761_00690 [Atribacter laminatus]